MATSHLVVKLSDGIITKRKRQPASLALCNSSQHNEFGLSFLGQVAWDTEPVFFFLGHFLFFRAPA